MKRSRRHVLVLGASAMTFGTLAGCLGDDGGPADADPADVEDEAFDHLGIESLELLDRASDPPEPVADVHDDHWHGGLPEIASGETLSLGATAETETGEPLEFGDEYDLKAALAVGGQDGIVSIDSHGDHVHVTGDAVGVTEFVFLVWHDDHADYQSPPLTVQVVDDDDE